MWPNPQFPADLVTFTEEILNGKLHFLCSVKFWFLKTSWKNPASIYLFKVNSGNANVPNMFNVNGLSNQNNINGLVLLSLLLTLNRFDTLFWCFHFWLWTSKHLNFFLYLWQYVKIKIFWCIGKSLLVFNYSNIAWKCPYSEFFLSSFSCIRTEYEHLLSKSPYSVWLRKATNQKISKYGHFT